MLLQAEMIELSNIVTGQTTPIFSKDIEKRLSTVEELVSKILDNMPTPTNASSKEGTNENNIQYVSKIEERFKSYDEILKKIRDFMNKSENVKIPLKEIEEINKKIQSVEDEIQHMKEFKTGKGIDNYQILSLKDEIDSLKKKISNEPNINNLNERISSIENKIDEFKTRSDNKSYEKIDDIKTEINQIKGIIIGCCFCGVFF